MKVAYLVNQYPKTSHSFIRREIAGVEAAGVEVVRFSVRATSEPLVDERDAAERARTTVLLDCGVAGLAGALARALLTRPRRVLRAVREALRLARVSPRGFLVHGAYLAEACLLRERLARTRVAHLHVHFATNAASVALLCRLLGGPPFSFTVHSTLSAENPREHALERKLAAAAFACAVSRHGLDVLKPLAGDTPLHLVRCGVDADFLESRPTPLPAIPRLLCVARFSPEKGHRVLLAAAGMLARAGERFELVLVGDGTERPAIEAAIEREALREHVHLRGWRDNREVRDELLAARALVIPSFVEGLPVVAMEALAMARPVVASAVGGLAELVEDGRTGRLVAPGDAAALAAGMRWAIGAQAAEHIHLGPLRVRAEHDAAREGAVIADLFRRVAAAPSGARPAPERTPASSMLS